MKIQIIPCLQDNYSYLIIDEKKNIACVVDPSEADPVIEYLEKNFPEIQNQYLDSSLISEDIGWKPEISIEQGLNESIDFYQQYLTK